MKFLHLLVLTCLILTGCGPVVRSPMLSTPPALSPAGAVSWKARLLRVAYDEWQFFGEQTVAYGDDEESIPHVGYWEDEDEAHSERVRRYWEAAGEPYLSGRDCDQAWSAAFIVWLMREAGVPASVFPATVSHRVYLAQFLADTSNAYFRPHTLAEYAPKPGDLICAIRENSVSGDRAKLAKPADLEQAKLHCDLVMQTDGRRLQAVGGNVRNSVSRSLLTLGPGGRLQPTAHRPWFLILENRLDQPGNSSPM